MIVHSQMPYNAETPLDRLRASRLTGQGDFYVRSHGAIPALTEATHQLTVGGRVAQPLDLTMADLRQRFAQRSVTAVLQCAGNRRADLHAVQQTSGDKWRAGAIGNAVWTGVALADVLTAAGVDIEAGLHVAFEACDTIESPRTGRIGYGVSIPLGKAMAAEVMLAYAMNGEALTPEHGYPLRLVVPGYAGVRSPKWLAAITVQDAPSDNPMQQDEYRFVPAGAASGAMIYDMPVTSAICEPAAGATLGAGRVTARGYAVATGRAVAQVDVSSDGGSHWTQAALEQDGGSQWSWAFWSAELDLPPGRRELVVRARDVAGLGQPERAEDVWNAKGYLSVAWHRVPVTVA